MKRLLVATAIVASLAGCSTTIPDAIARDDAQKMSTVIDDVVGDAAERMCTHDEAVDLLVQRQGSETRVTGDAVIIVTTGGKVRVSRAPVVGKSG